MMELTLDLDVLREHASTAEEGILDGRALKRAMLSQLGLATSLLTERGITPKLAVIQVGDDPASSIYVKHKIRACQKIGVESIKLDLATSTTRAELHASLESLNQDESIHGILLQLPLPEHLDPNDAIQMIDPAKDVDGFHPANLGELMAWRGTLEPCTPRGVMTMLRAFDVELEGVDAVVVGRSMTVGRPMAQMLMRANTSVTVCHRHTRDLAAHIRRAELVVVAAGVPNLIRGEWIREGAVVIDVGISRLADGSLTGDVEFDAARERARLITPVPGGVGQMTVATLMENTIRIACKSNDVALDLSASRG